jgi:putative acetyltransferase
MFTIRPAQPSDASGIDAVHQQAFPSDAEARLVALLIGRGKGCVSLVAEADGQVVGHLLFSPATIESADRPAIEGLGLAPLAVVPTWQRRGVGSTLMGAGMAACRRLGVPFVVLVGHSEYYPRFGFVPAGSYGLTCDFGSGDSFQIAVLGDVPIESGGAVRYAPEFYELFAPPAE